MLLTALLALGAPLLCAATGALVPLYAAPDDPSWSQLAASIKAHPTVAFTVIVNPASGPGHAPVSDAFKAGIASLRAAGKPTILGYVATDLGKKEVKAVEAEIQAYQGWTGAAGLDDVFFDEAATDADSVGTYTTWAKYVRAGPWATERSFVMLNPGTDTDVLYYDFTDLVCTFEGTLDAWNSVTPASSHISQQAVIIHDAPPSTDVGSALSPIVTAGYGGAFLTDETIGSATDKYRSLGALFENEVAVLAKASPGPGDSSDGSMTMQAASSTAPATTTGGPRRLAKE